MNHRIISQADIYNKTRLLIVSLSRQRNTDKTNFPNEKPKKSSNYAKTPQADIFDATFGFPDFVPLVSSFDTISNPSVISPKQTCLLSNHGVGTVVMKNCDPLVFFPEFAIDNSPGLVCLTVKFSSSNVSPYILFPPVPFLFVKSPPWIINCGIIRWNGQSLKPIPFSCVHSARKFSAVSGTISLYSWSYTASKRYPLNYKKTYFERNSPQWFAVHLDVEITLNPLRWHFYINNGNR